MALYFQKRAKRILSFSDSTVAYTFDEVEGTCSCPAFQHHATCKHVQAAGWYPVKHWTPPAVPTFSQALSGLVKTLRLRRKEEAVYWLLWLMSRGTSTEGYRFRVARRLLIGSAEDGHSISVMEKVASNFTTLCKPETPVINFVAEVLRICAVANWWDPATNGPDYIRAGLIANRQAHLYKAGGDSSKEHLDTLEAGIEQKDPVTAIIGLERLIAGKEHTSAAIAQLLADLAEQRHCAQAARLAAIHLQHKSALHGDANFLTQATWWLAGGSSPVADEIHPVLYGEALEVLQEQDAKLGTVPLPPAYCDGIHCGGADRRFAGMWPDMFAVCKAYGYYGELNPELPWKREFYSLEGLEFV